MAQRTVDGSARAAHPWRRVVVALVVALAAAGGGTVAAPAGAAVADGGATPATAAAGRTETDGASAGAEGEGAGVAGVGASAATARSIAVGLGHGCAVTEAGGVRCWGSNDQGEIGNDTPPPTPWPGAAPPADVLGLDDVEVAAVAVGGSHSCALTTAGEVRCWGSDQQGQLGSTAVSDRSRVAVPVTGLSGVRSLAAGSGHTCAVIADGEVRCWGDDMYGRLGNGSAGSSGTPVAVVGITDVAAVSSSSSHTCALTTAGAVWCWGLNNAGQLGAGTLTDAAVPVPVVGLDAGVTDVRTGFSHTCATTEDGAACWGDNEHGQLGDGTVAPSSVPVPVQGLPNDVVAVGPGSSATCALRLDGTVWCWGSSQSYALGHLSGTSSLTPRPVSDVDDAHALAVGGSVGCVLRISGRASCWSDTGSRRGDGILIRGAPVPIDVAGIPASVVAVASGRAHHCAYGSEGAVCWGDMKRGQLGRPMTRPHFPTQHSPEAPGVVGPVTGLGSTLAVDAGQWQTCAVTGAGAVRCWGSEAGGAGGWNPTPKDVAGLASGVVDVAAGVLHSCVVVTGAGVRCWGTGTDGRLGNGGTTSSSSPVSVTGLPADVVEVDAGPGGASTCARTDAGAVWCWGLGTDGQLGHGATTSSSVPVPVSGLGGGVAAMAVGDRSACAVMSGGGVRCWGANTYGQLGSSAPAVRSAVPVAVPGVEDVAAVTVGEAHACAVTTAGGVTCWGVAGSGQIGDGTFVTSRPPTPVLGLASGVVSVSAAGSSTCARSASGTTSCWGAPFDWQVGQRFVADVLGGAVYDQLPVAPGAPTDVMADAGSQRATVSWTAPMDDGGATITGYEVTPSVDGVAGEPQAFAADATTATVTGLANGVTHTFTVRAINVAGTGPASDPSDPVTPVGVVLEAGPDPVTAGQEVTLTGTSTVGDAGWMSFYDGSTLIGTRTTAAGVATMTTTRLKAGDHSLTVVYQRSSSSTPVSSEAVVLTVGEAATSVVLDTSVQPSVWGQPVRVRAVVTAVAPATGTPTGTVTIRDGDVVVRTLALAGGVASFNATPTTGEHRYTATYGGSATFAPSTSGPLDHDVEPAATTVAVTASANPSVAGQPVTIKAIVRTAAPGAGTPTGLVDIYDEGELVATRSLVGGAATLSAQRPGVGLHVYTAVYRGSDDSVGSASAELAHSVVRATTKVTLSSSAPTATLGQRGTVKAVVTVLAPGSGSPAGGTVELYDDDVLVATLPVDGTRAATLPIADLDVGEHHLTAVFVGTGNLAPSTSAVLVQTITGSGR